MLDTRLILLDGIPGSGKSTTAQRLYLHLLRHGHAARWFYEFDDNHPILRPDEREQLLESDTVDTDELCQQFLARWRALAESLHDDPRVTILDGALFQVPVGLLMLRNVDRQKIVQHQLDVETCIASLNPVLVYLYQEDVATAVNTVCDLRREHQFAESLVEFVANTPYGKTRSVDSLADVITFFEQKQEITMTVLDVLEICTVRIEIFAREWPQYERRVTEQLGLPEIASLNEANIEAPQQYVGRYRSDGDSDDLLVSLGPTGICLNGRERLIHKQDNTFFVEATCLEVTFHEDEDGVIERLQVTGPLEIPESEWTRVASLP